MEEKYTTSITHTDVDANIYAGPEEYKSFIDAMTVQLLTFFEKVNYYDDVNNRSYLLGFIGEVGIKPNNYMAQQTFYAPDYLQYYREGSLEAKMADDMVLAREQMKKSNPRW